MTSKIPGKWCREEWTLAPPASILEFLPSAIVTNKTWKEPRNGHTVVDSIERCTQFLYPRIIPHVNALISHAEISQALRDC